MFLPHLAPQRARNEEFLKLHKSCVFSCKGHPGCFLTTSKQKKNLSLLSVRGWRCHESQILLENVGLGVHTVNLFAVVVVVRLLVFIDLYLC